MELTITNLSKTYPNGVKALNNISLTIPQGMFGLLGPNGAGKSTLMRTIATLQDPDSGSVLLDNINVLEDTINDIDLVCLMSVNPGFGGQSFIENTFNKVEQLKALIKNKNAKTLIEIDGGVTNKNAKQLADAGADVLVAGSYVFNSSDQIKTIADLRVIANS